MEGWELEWFEDSDDYYFKDWWSWDKDYFKEDEKKLLSGLKKEKTV